MAGPIKKKAVEVQENTDSNESGSDLSDNDNEDIYTGQKEIQATFEGRNPEGCDFHGIKQLLQQLFLKAHIDLSQLSDVIIAQNNVGSVLKQSIDDEEEGDSDDDDDDLDDVFGITTVINITEKKKTECIQQLRNLLFELAEKYADNDTVNTIKNILNNDSKHVGLLINERFVNIPAQISDPLFESLVKEINRANSKKMSFDFAYYLLICKLYKQDLTNIEKNKPGEIYFSNPEEEIFDEEAELKFEFSVKNESDSGVSGHWLEDDETMIPYRRVLLFPAEKLPTILQKIKTFVSSN